MTPATSSAAAGHTPEPTGQAIDLIDEINSSLQACEEFAEMLRFFTTHAEDLGEISDERKVWAGVSRVHEFIGEEVASAHEKVNALYAVTMAALEKAGAR